MRNRAPAEAQIPPAAREAILAWYGQAGRRLAFRASSDPYAVLVSELMAQQTQAERAAVAWSRWMERWPTPADLAAASVAEVLRQWAGLGYNRRALALHRAAQAILAGHDGRVPDDLAALEALPGVGRYTARAVAAIAFNQPVGAVDTNVRRVLGRVLGASWTAATEAERQAIADAVVPTGSAAAWTHALMDLGAGPCRPRAPRCGACPASRWCGYAAGAREREGDVDQPARTRPRPVPAFETTRRWLRGRVLARAREASDGDWVAYPEPMGCHPIDAVREAVVALAGEGMVEAREGAEGIEARLPR